MKNQGATMDVDQYVFADFVRNDLFGGFLCFQEDLKASMDPIQSLLGPL